MKLYYQKATIELFLVIESFSFAVLKAHIYHKLFTESIILETYPDNPNDLFYLPSNSPLTTLERVIVTRIAKCIFQDINSGVIDIRNL